VSVTAFFLMKNVLRHGREKISDWLQKIKTPTELKCIKLTNNVPSDFFFQS